MNDEPREIASSEDEDVQGHFRPNEEEMFGEDTEGHIAPQGGRPGPGSQVGGRFRPDEDAMFGEDVAGHGDPFPRAGGETDV